MAFSSIRIEGAILSPEILDQISKGTRSHQESDSFGLPSRTSVKDEIQSAWGEAVHHWKIFRQRLERLRKSETPEGVTRKYWVVPLLELLGYELDSANAEMVGGKSYAINHRVTALGGLPIQIVSCERELDKRAADGGPRLSPHGLLQEYLNVTEHLYGIVTNGEILRLLRDNSRLIRLSYLEFDLRRMMDEDQYGEFALLFRLLHQSRMPRDPATTSESVLERYHQDSLDDGARIRERLSTAVEKCLEKLGTGLLRHPANTRLREEIGSGVQEPRAYLQTLFHEIYRVLFLMVLEERDLIFPEGTEPKLRDVYYRYYSLRKVRLQSEHIPLFPERHSDLWLGLRETFQLFSPSGKGPALGVPPLGGELFSANGLAELHDWFLDNKTVLECFSLLNSFEDPQTRTRIRVNYASLNVEEFGSVYETLLEREGRFTGLGQEMFFQLVRGDERGETGSHYTPDTLVVPLIQHSLDHLIEARLAASADKKTREIALLTLRICDPSCGSGHILLNAARRVGLELARVRTGEDQPSPSYVRWAVRDVIAHCIYGVDKNPLAVELCKVALWLESHTPGEPLGFLDHRIKCGDAVVGLCRREELERGISEEAFAAVGNLSAEDKKALSEMRKRIQSDRKALSSTKGSQDLLLPVGQAVSELLAHLDRLDVLPEHTPEQVETKTNAYQQILSGRLWWGLKSLSDLQVAQFFLSKTINHQHLWTSQAEYHRELMAPGYISKQKIGAAMEESGQRRFFHWFLEFPEVLAAGGFDCVLGNPPFLGNRGLRGAYGEDYLHYITSTFECGAIDFSGYFFRRAFSVLKAGGFFGLIATNTIAQGGTREGGLAVIAEQGGTLIHAMRSVRWPGKAAVQVSLVNVTKGAWRGKKWLDGRNVQELTTYLDDSVPLADPYPLGDNRDKSFIGSYVLGKGFILNSEVAFRLIERDQRNKDVLFPYLNGDDLNSRPDQSPSRWVINFHDWTEDKARSYPEVFEFIEREVKPERTRLKEDGSFVLRSPLPQKWWIYGDKRPKLYKTIAPMTRVIVIAIVSKTHAPAYFDPLTVFAHKTAVFVAQNSSFFGVIQSSFHNEWAWKQSSTMKSDRNYSPSDCFITFPFPVGNATDEVLGQTAELLHDTRSSLTRRLGVGFTKLYNLMNDPALSSIARNDLESIGSSTGKVFIDRFGKAAWDLKRILEGLVEPIAFDVAIDQLQILQKLHQNLDEAVLEAYGWHKPGPDGPAIRLEHGFHEVDYLPENDRVRFTISPEARKEILHRLLLLNHKRHAEEVARNGANAVWISGEDDADELLEGGAEVAPKPKAARAKKASKAGQEELGL